MARCGKQINAREHEARRWPSQAWIADETFERTRGLLGRPTLNMKSRINMGVVRRIGFSVLLAAVVGATSGCLAVAAGAGAGAAVAYVRGELRVTLPSNYEATSRATNRAIEQLQFTKVSERKDALLDLIEARNAADKKIEIRLENTARELTKVRIRIGIFGDEALSMAILDKIKANL
jgi:hypothetical protein